MLGLIWVTFYSLGCQEVSCGQGDGALMGIINTAIYSYNQDVDILQNLINYFSSVAFILSNTNTQRCSLYIGQVSRRFFNLKCLKSVLGWESINTGDFHYMLQLGAIFDYSEKMLDFISHCKRRQGMHLSHVDVFDSMQWPCFMKIE